MIDDLFARAYHSAPWIMTLLQMVLEFGVFLLLVLLAIAIIVPTPTLRYDYFADDEEEKTEEPWEQVNGQSDTKRD